MQSANTPSQAGPTIWVDVEDTFAYFEESFRPSGVQRLLHELLRVLPARAAACPGSPRIALVRHVADGRLLREVAFAEFDALFRAGRPEPRPSRSLELRPAAPAPPGFLVNLRRLLVLEIERLPPHVARDLIQAGVAQMNALRRVGRGVAALRQPSRRPATALPARPALADAAGEQAASVRTDAGCPARPGDVFLVAGAPWSDAGYGTLLRTLRDRHGVASVGLMYDLIPLRHPEWCVDLLVRDFRAYLGSALPVFARLMAISRATAQDVADFAAEAGLPVALPVRPIPIGTAFGGAKSAPGDAARPPGLPRPGSYVLFVSTVEARKNHLLLFRVWRRLLAELPRDEVPTLVFAGRVGWLVADLLQQLDNVDWFHGRIRLLRDPSDAELAALYEGCRFTVFPSFAEGWGLPVTESLAHGRPCVAANRTSLPEAGGALARYFDPDNVDDAYDVIRGTIVDAPGLDAWRAQVAREFRPTPWEDTADAVLGICLDAARTDARRAA